jgi:uncharacterized membrane protein YgcG
LQRLQRTRSAVVAPAEEEVASPLRFYLFSYMTAVLLFFTGWGEAGNPARPPAGCMPTQLSSALQRRPRPGRLPACPSTPAADHSKSVALVPAPPTAADLLTSDSPSLGLDAIYAALAAILGLNLFNERKLLVEQGLGQQGGGGSGGSGEDGSSGSSGGGGSGSSSSSSRDA